jgi:hypothetical protein
MARTFTREVLGVTLVLHGLANAVMRCGRSTRPPPAAGSRHDADLRTGDSGFVVAGLGVMHVGSNGCSVPTSATCWKSDRSRRHASPAIVADRGPNHQPRAAISLREQHERAQVFQHQRAIRFRVQDSPAWPLVEEPPEVAGLCGEAQSERPTT